jgi:sulfur carrier protein ThiS
MTVQRLLERLELSPESVLVIVDDELVTHDRRLDDAASVEIRPVVSGGAA